MAINRKLFIHFRIRSLGTMDCDVCKKRKKTSTTQNVCVECREFYCRECSETHLDFKMSSNHTLLGVVLPVPGVENIKAESTTNTSRQNSRKRSFRRVDSAAEPFESSGSSATAVRAQSPINKKPPIQVQKAAKISIQIASDSEHPMVNGIAATKDFIVVRDNANNKLKLFNVRGGLEKTVDINDSYFDNGIVLANQRTMASNEGSKIVLYRISMNEFVKEKDILSFLVWAIL